MSNFIYASYPDFSSHEIQHIEKKFGRISKNRVQDYLQTIKSFEGMSKKKQLIRVNAYLNRLLPQYDQVTQNQEDHWETPKGFLILGYGDCEDYVIIKYFTLIKLGFDEKKLFITTVKDKYLGGYHMVLSYFKQTRKPPLILDNLSFKILDLKKRKDLKVDYFINSHGVFKINKNYELIKIAHNSAQFNELKARIDKEQ